MQPIIAQDKINFIKTYTQKDGLAFSYIKSMAYDKNGFLWLGGYASEVAGSVFNNEELILQRFNGYTFDTFKFQLDTKSKSTKITDITVRNDTNFYLIIHADFVGEYIYYFDTSTLELKKIKLPNNVKSTYIKLFKNSNNDDKKDKIYAFIKVKEHTKIYILNDNFSFKYLFKISNNNEKMLGYTYFKPYKNHCVISEFRQGVNIFDWNGKLIKSFNKNKHSSDNSYHITSSFNKGIDNYVIFNDVNNAYKYNSITKIFHKTNDYYKTKSSVKDTLNQSAIVFTKNNKNILKRFIKGEPEFDVSSFNKINVLFSPNLKKELWLATKGKLYHIIFSESHIKKYLTNYSIRNILALNKKEFLVATENNGLFTVNILTNNVKPYQLKYKSKYFVAKQIRGLIKDDTTIWSNYDAGLLKINTKTKNVNYWRYYPVECMYQSAENKLYYGTIYKSIMEFDKEKHLQKSIVKTDSTWILDIKQNKNNTLFAATNKGLLKYNLKTKESKFYNKSNGLEDAYILSLQNHPKHDLLLGTKTGLLYSFNENTNTFKLIYKDKLNASIASVLFLDQDNLWINTFNGIVSYNTITKETHRFSVDDGLSHYEMNRYSYLKTTDNHFFVGSVKGLNYFNPKNLNTNKNKALLKLTSVTYYNKQTEKLITEKTTKILNTLKKISLPSENRFLKLGFAINNLTLNTDNIGFKYRLNHNEWQDFDNQNKLQFQNMEPGKYNLEIKTFNNLNEPISNSLVIKINAKNYFYKTWWFALFIFLSVVLGSLFLIKQAQKRQQLEADFSRKLLIAQDEERKRISRDLHDAIGQNLMLLKRKASKNKNKDLEELAANTLDEMRSITKALHPSILEKLGLTSAITSFINDVDKNTEIFFTQEIENIDGLISKENEVHLFRIIQESVTNLVKHANSKVAFVKIKKENSKLLIQIEDKGIGFNYEENETFKHSLGMKTLEERSSILNAIFSIKSKKGIGTNLEFSIPINIKSI